MVAVRFRHRILLSFSTIALLPILSLGVGGPIIYSRTVRNLSAEYTRNLVARVTDSLEVTVRAHEQMMKLLLSDPEVTRFFSGADLQEGRMKERIEALFESVKRSHPAVSGVIAVAADDRYVSPHLTRIVRDPLSSESWYTRTRDSSRQFNLVTRPIGRNLRSRGGIGSDQIASLIRSVRDSATGQLTGVLMVDMRLKHIAASLNRIQKEEREHTFFCILDGDGNYVYAPENPIVYRINPAWFTDSKRIIDRTINGRGYRLIFTESTYMGWKTVGVYSHDQALRPVRFIQMSAAFIAVLTIVFTVMISILYSSAISNPVLHLQSVVERVGHGDLTVRYDGQGHDEIHELGQGLNWMLDEIEKLLDLVYHEQKSKREAELRILQQQIKPHFLYNTLDTILWMAEEESNTEIVEVVTALTGLFRVALSQGDEEIPVASEIAHVRSYLTIQKVRYEDKFRFSIECPDELYSLRVQKMILQPLVENALYHGIKEKRGAGTIRVTVRRSGSLLEMHVADDGVGIPREQLTTISNGLKRFDHTVDRGAFALYNVNDRIGLTYGSGYGLTVRSTVGVGTTVTITHPIITGV